MKTTGSRASAVSQTRGFGDLLYDKAGARPSLDLDFAGTSSLRDKITGEYLVDHTRATKGTYINNEGLIKEAAINYVTNHKGINNSTGSDSILNPEGNLESIPYISGAPLNHRFSGASLGGTVGQKYTGSVYLRTDQGTSPVELDVSDQNNTIVTVTDQWQRFVVVQTNQSVAGYRFFDILTSDGSSYAHIGQTFGNNGSSKIYVWGAQLEEGTSGTPTDLIKTTGTTKSAPRFTHERVETGNLLTDSTLKNPNHIKPHIRILQYQALAPDGTFSAAEMRCISSATNYMFANPTTSHIGIKDNTAYTVSIFAKKANTLDTFSIFLSEGGNKGATFNLTNKTATVYGGGQNTARITETDNGWFRCEVTNSGNPTTVTSQIRLGLLSTTFVQQAVTAGQSFYFWGFQFEEGEAASTVAPSINTFTSRLSNATYVDSAGLVKKVLVNKYPNSKDLNASTWTAQNTTKTVNAITSPDGNLTATLFKDSGTTTTHRNVYRNQWESADNGISTISIYAKAGGYNHAAIRVYKSINDHVTPVFNLTGNGSVTTTEVDGTQISNYSSNIEYVGDGWYRLSVTVTVSGTFVAFYHLSNSGTPTFDQWGSPSYAGDTSKGIYFWGAQRVSSSQPETLIETGALASGPARYSHDPETLTPTGLYLEPAATNKANNSNSTDGKTVVGGTLTASSETAPDGSTTALTFTEDTSNGHHRYFEGKSLTAGTYTWSIFVKPINRSVVYIRFAPSSNYSGASFDTQSKTFTTISNGYTGRYTEYPNGWFRVSVTATFTSTATQFFALESRTGEAGVGQSYVGNGLPAFHQWGGQLELGHFASSYIYTSGSEVTRATDTYTSTANLTETFEPRGLLIEEARTNKATKSHQVGDADGNGDWRRDGTLGSTPSNPDYTSPMGTTSDLRTVFEAGNTSSHNLYHNTVALGSAATCATVFIKPLRTDRDLQIRCTGIGSSAPWVNYDLNDGTITNYAGTSGTSSGNRSWTMSPPLLEKYPNGWYRVGFVNLSVSQAHGQSGWLFGIYIQPKGHNAESTTFTGSNVDVFSAWGAQYEEGAFPTSYIHNTTTSTLTRSADVASITGDNFGTYRTNFITQSENLWNWNQGSEHVTPYAYPNPVDGKYDAALVSYDGTNNGRLNLPTTVSATTLGYSVYVKPVSNPCFIQLYTQRGDNGLANFDLINKTHAGDGTRNITEVGNGWLRLEWITLTSATYPSNVNISFLVDSLTSIRAGGSTSSSTFYLYAPQIEANLVTNYIPSTDTFTSRLGNATYVDSNGLIKTAKVNELKYTTDFSNNYWGVDTGTKTVLTTSTPDGQDSVAKFTRNQTNWGRFKNSTGHVSFDTNTTYTASVYAKADGNRYLHFRVGSGNAYRTGTAFDLQEGLVLNQGYFDGTQSLNTPISSSIEDAGDGWFRCIITYNNINTNHLWFYPSNSATTTSDATGNGQSQLYWHPQIVEGTEALEFIPTGASHSGGPRYSHDPETLVPTGLYLEPAATNLRSYSENLTNSTAWNVYGSASGTSLTRTQDPNIVNPTGSNGATKIEIIRSDLNAWRAVRSGGITIPGSDVNTVSAWIKAATPSDVGKLVSIWQYDSGFRFMQHVALTDKWVRFSITSDQATGFTAEPFNIGVLQNHHVVDGVVNNETSVNFYVWGVQIETGSYASSYIPTTNSTVTRAADTYASIATTVLDRDGGNKEAFYNQGGSRSVFVNYGKAFNNYDRIFAFKPSGNSDAFIQWDLVDNDTSGLRFRSQTGDHTLYAPSAKLFNKTAFGFDDNNSGSAGNGVIGDASSALTLPTTTDSLRPLYMRIGMHMSQNSGFLNNSISRLTFWKTRLPDSSLINITT